MKQYPSIDGHIVHLPVIAFDKLDGSNIRCEWNRKKGLHKFGSRKVLLGADHTVLGESRELRTREVRRRAWAHLHGPALAGDNVLLRVPRSSLFRWAA